MNPVVVRSLDRALASGPVTIASEKINGNRLRVLAYHGVDDPLSFSRQMQHVRDHYEPVSLTDLVAARRGSAPLPDRAVLVTFDDGERNVLHEGVPILHRYSVPAVVFVIAGALSQDSMPFWWREVEALLVGGAQSSRLGGRNAVDAVRMLKRVGDAERLDIIEELRGAVEGERLTSTHVSVAELHELASGGLDIGNHSLTHPCLVRCSVEKVLDEVQGAHDILTGHLGSPPIAFAYPNGDCDDQVRAAVEACGYELGFLFDHRLTAFSAAQGLALSRLRVNSHTPIDRFISILSGAHPALHRWRGRS